MTEDAKAVKKRRLAEALRSNLMRRKAAAKKGAEAVSEQAQAHPSAEIDGPSKG